MALLRHLIKQSIRFNIVLFGSAKRFRELFPARPIANNKRSKKARVFACLPRQQGKRIRLSQVKTSNDNIGAGDPIFTESPVQWRFSESQKTTKQARPSSTLFSIRFLFFRDWRKHREISGKSLGKDSFFGPVFTEIYERFASLVFGFSGRFQSRVEFYKSKRSLAFGISIASVGKKMSLLSGQITPRFCEMISRLLVSSAGGGKGRMETLP